MATVIIKGFPNSENGNKAAQILKDFSRYSYRKHGRGHRFGNQSTKGRTGRYAYENSLPLWLSARFTLYGYEKDRQRDIDDGWRRDYWRYMGLRDGKPVIRQCQA